MASSYTVLGTEKMVTGENAGNWGTKTNTNLVILEQALGGYLAKSIAGGVQTTTLAITDGDSTASTSEARHHVIKLTGTITGNQTVTVPADVVKSYIVSNATSGAYTVLFKAASASGFTFAATNKGTQLLFADGTNIVDTGISSVGSNDLDGDELILDADADTSITADTDDQIDIKVGGTDRVRITTGAIAPSSADGIALGTSALEFSDLFLADSSVIKFGADQDTTLTHTDGTGLTLNSTNKLCFYDTALYIHSSTDGQLDLVADTEIQIAATTIDINGAVALNGAITGATDITLSGELDAATLDISGNADIDGTTNLDAVDIDGAVQIDAAFTSGVDGQGYDTKFFGDTSSAYMLWDTSADDLVFAGAAGIDLAGDIDVDGTANLDVVDIDGAVDMASTLAVAGVSSFAVAANVAQVALTSSSNAVAWDASAAANAYHLTTENTTISAPSNAVEGAFICLELNHDGTTTVAWNAIFNFAADTAPTTTDTNAKTDILVFRYNGAIWQEVGRTLNIPES